MHTHVRTGAGHEPVSRYQEKIDEISRLLAAYPWEPRHSVQVRLLALSIFDQTARLHLLGPRERFLLEAAAMLHDIGFTIGCLKHHKHSQKIITACDFNAICREEAGLIAQIARYHRKAHPKLTHPPYRKLDNYHRDIVRKLSAILRIADGLDRTHTQSVKVVEVSEGADTVSILLKPAAVPREDIAGAVKKKGLFEEVFEKRLRIVANT